MALRLASKMCQRFRQEYAVQIAAVQPSDSIFLINQYGRATARADDLANASDSAPGVAVFVVAEFHFT